MKLDFRNTNSLWCGVLAETLHRSGVRHAVVSPGSRSTPLVFALASHPKIEAIPVLDERSASFFALGLAKQSVAHPDAQSGAQSVAHPVALVCTSGTAAANFFPAIIEAQESGVPLLVITADRPPEMRDCGSGQTIDQQKLYGSHVNWYHELAVPEASLERLRYLRQTVAHACARATEPERGPVHLNAPFRDPLPPLADGAAEHLRGKIDAGFFDFLLHNRRASADWYHEDIGGFIVHGRKRGLIVAGPGADDCRMLALASGWPVLSDVLSGARHAKRGVGEEDLTMVSAYDAILRNDRMAAELAPELVLCVGGWPVSKALRAWIEKCAPEIYMAGPGSKNLDALHGLTTSRLFDDTGSPRFTPVREDLRGDPDYLAAWRKAEAAARAALDSSFAKIADTDFFEPRAAWLLAKHLPERTPVFIANSMPVRDAEYFWPATTRGHQFYFNRGANGIDGTLSTALGVAHGNERPAVLLTGDLALLHDTNGFLIAAQSDAVARAASPCSQNMGKLPMPLESRGLEARATSKPTGWQPVPRRFRGSLTIVLINNNGGGIFESLPVAKFDPPFETYFATPQNADFAKLCAAYGVEHTRIESWSQFTQLISALPARGVRVLEIRADRKRDTARRKALLAQAANANTTGA